MGVRDYWDRMLVYFGIAGEVDEHDEANDWDEESVDNRVSTEESRRVRVDKRANIREASTHRRAAASKRPVAGQSVAGVGMVSPRTFNDAQRIADQFKDGRPVIVNLQTSDSDLSRRIIDFASGLTYGLDGRMQNIAEKVFLLSPDDVDVPDEDRAAMLESGFFNQS